MRNHMRRTLVLVLLLLILTSIARAAPGPGQIVRSALASGGQRVQAGNWALNGTLGESVAGPVVFHGTRGVASGYWYKITGGGVVSLPVIRR